jgi:hypothetical protein
MRVLIAVYPEKKQQQQQLYNMNSHAEAQIQAYREVLVSHVNSF